MVFATRLLTVAAMANEAVGLHDPDPLTLVNEIQRIDQLDSLAIAYAAWRLPQDTPLAWVRIAELLSQFTERSIPKAFQGRDKRIAALVIYLQETDCDHGVVMRAIASACHHDDQLFNAVMNNLRQDGGLIEAAKVVLNRRSAQLTEETLHETNAPS